MEAGHLNRTMYALHTNNSSHIVHAVRTTLVHRGYHAPIATLLAHRCSQHMYRTFALEGTSMKSLQLSVDSFRHEFPHCPSLALFEARLRNKVTS